MFDQESSFAGMSGTSPLVAAAGWIERVVLGSVATTIAVLAIATVGLMMLAGRIDLRRGFTVVLGCFVIFGAQTIVAGLRSATSSIGSSDTPPVYVSEPTLPPPVVAPKQVDPYGGAAVPHQNNGNPWAS